MPAPRVAASVTYTDVRHSFYEEIAAGDQYWWWICDFIMSPPTVIADDDESGLWSIPYTLGGETVAWGEPVEVRVQYVEKETGKVAASKPADLDGFRAEYIGAGGSVRLAAPAQPVFTAATSRPTDRVRAENPEQRSNDVDISTLREHLEMPDATDDEVIAAAAEKLATTPTPAADGGEETTPPDESQEPAAAIVDPAALAQLQEDAQLGREAREQQLTTDREAFIKAAVADGKFPPTSGPSYLEQLNRGGEIEKTTRSFIDKLAANVVPVKERGTAGDSQNDEQAALANVRAHLGLKQPATN